MAHVFSTSHLRFVLDGLQQLLKYKTNKTAAAACLKRTTDITFHDNLIEILDINWDIKRCMSKAKDLVLGLKGPFLHTGKALRRQ